MIQKACAQGQLKGFKVKKEGAQVTHLQFGDDPLFFIKSQENQVRLLKNMLMMFSVSSVLNFNFSKSALYPIGEEGNIDRTTNIPNIGTTIGLYLGLPLGAQSGRKELWRR